MEDPEDDEDEKEVKPSFTVPRTQTFDDEDDDLGDYDEDADEEEVEEIVSIPPHPKAVGFMS